MNGTRKTIDPRVARRWKRIAAASFVLFAIQGCYAFCGGVTYNTGSGPMLVLQELVHRPFDQLMPWAVAVFILIPAVFVLAVFPITPIVVLSSPLTRSMRLVWIILMAGLFLAIAVTVTLETVVEGWSWDRVPRDGECSQLWPLTWGELIAGLFVFRQMFGATLGVAAKELAAHSEKVRRE